MLKKMEVIEAIFSNLRLLWNLPFAREVILVGITAMLTHFFSVRKLKKERRTKYQDKIGENIATALTAVREISMSTKTFEIYQYCIDNSPADNANALSDSAYYPAFMANKATFFQMIEMVSNAREKHEPYLDFMSAAYIYVFERYLMNLALYAKKNGLQENLNVMGMILIVDIHKWENKFDRHLVKQLNLPHYKLFSRHGWRWKLAKYYVERKYLLNTELDKIMKTSVKMPDESAGDPTNA